MRMVGFLCKYSIITWSQLPSSDINQHMSVRGLPRTGEEYRRVARSSALHTHQPDLLLLLPPCATSLHCYIDASFNLLGLQHSLRGGVGVSRALVGFNEPSASTTTNILLMDSLAICLALHYLLSSLTHIVSHSVC